MLSDAQTWSVIGGVFGVVGILLGIVMTSFNNQQKSLRTELVGSIASLRTELKSDIAQLAIQTDSFQTQTLLRFDTVDRRFDGVDRHLAALDRDMQAVTQRVFRSGPEVS